MDLFTFLSILLSDDIKKELNKYSQEKKAQYKPTYPRMVKVLDIPEPDLENHHPDDSYPMQDSDIEDLQETHGHHSAKMRSTYHISKHSSSSY